MRATWNGAVLAESDDTVVVEGNHYFPTVNKDAAWYYPEPKDAAKQIFDHVAFWKGVEVEG
jgi:uncharacterized protein (DUF427 family)